MTGERSAPIARAVGICLVVYSYLGGLWLDRHGEVSAVVDVAREWLNRPLGIGEDFGVLGMMLLLLTSGHAAVSADPASGWRRDLRGLARIAVPLAVGAALTGVFLLLDVEVLVQPVALVLGIELVAWSTGALAVRTNAWLVPLGQLLAVAGVLLAGGISPDFAMPLVLFPLAVLGQAIGRLPGWAAALLGVAVWGLLVWTEHVHPAAADWWYPLTALYAVLFFLIALRARDTTRAVRWLADHARWLLVLTGALGWAVLGLGLPFPVGFPIALAAVALVAALAGRFGRTGEVSP